MGRAMTGTLPQLWPVVVFFAFVGFYRMAGDLGVILHGCWWLLRDWYKHR